MRKYKHFIFDLDGTMCISRENISLDMHATITMLRSMGHTVTIVSGAEVERIKKQIGELEVDYMLGQCGTESPFWKKKMSERDEVEVRRHIQKIQNRLFEYDWGKGPSDERFVENRGSQITFSLTGFDCDSKIKKEFDPTTSRRRQIMKEIPFISLSMECKVAGNTSLDYTHKDYTKGKNIARLIRNRDWYTHDCIYFGDRFYEGGNDETVKGVVVDCVVVAGPADLISKLKEYI